MYTCFWQRKQVFYPSYRPQSNVQPNIENNVSRYLPPFFFKMLLTMRTIVNVPKATPDQKGRNPEPGWWKVPILSPRDTAQTKMETTSQYRPLNWSQIFIIPGKLIGYPTPNSSRGGLRKLPCGLVSLFPYIKSPFL